MTHYNPTYITINKAKLKYNIQHSYDLCKEKSVNLAVVAKSICASEEIIRVIYESPVDTIADSRLDNLKNFGAEKIRLLIRPAAPCEAASVVMYSDISFVTEKISAEAINAAAKAAGKVHDVLLMTDIGDLRDGIYFTDHSSITELASYIHEAENLRLAGIAVNYNCFLGYLPDSKNIDALGRLDAMLKAYYDVDNPIVSGGNSSAISMLTGKSGVPCGSINQFRMGEAVMLGRDPADNTLIPGYCHDVFTLHVSLIEVQIKPVENGTYMRRGILEIGKQDLQIEHIIPKDNRIKLLGGCSDECVIDLSEAPEYRVGDLIDFDLEYGALMTAFANSYVGKVYVD